jgi:hypothetical protein
VPMNPRTLQTRPEPMRPISDRRTHRPNNGATIVILGSCRDNAFVADQVLVEAGTLEAETAIRSWLQEHDMRLAASLRSALSREGQGP